MKKWWRHTETFPVSALQANNCKQKGTTLKQKNTVYTNLHIEQQIWQVVWDPNLLIPVQKMLESVYILFVNRIICNIFTPYNFLSGILDSTSCFCNMFRCTWFISTVWLQYWRHQQPQTSEYEIEIVYFWWQFLQFNCLLWRSIV